MIQKVKLKKAIVLDCNALIHRAYHALPPLTTPKGEVVNAVYGFLLVFFKAVRDIAPDFIFATFDVKGPTFRHRDFKEYKAQRVKAPDELYLQIPTVERFLREFHVPIFGKEGFEADDLIGTITLRLKESHRKPTPEAVIVTGDLDALQLVDDSTKVLTLRKGLSDSVLYGTKEVEERFGFSPAYMNDYKGLRGDPSDNVPGVKGVGEKTAAELIKKFGTIEKLYEELSAGSSRAKKLNKRLQEKLITHKDEAFLSKGLVTIKRDVDIDFSLQEGSWGKFDMEAVRRLLKEYGFFSLVDKVPLVRLSDKPASEGGGAVAAPSQKVDEEFSREKRVREEIEELLRSGMISEKLYEVEKSLIPIIDSMERWGICVDKKQLADLQVKLDKMLLGLEERITKFAGTSFNISSPQQVSEVLFQKLQLPTKGLKKTPGGVISTAAPELVKLKGEHPIVDALLEHRELMKLKTTYVDALPKLIHPKTGRIHTTFNQLGAATGRMSSSDPNLQNIPIRGELGKEIRRAFVPAEGFVFLSADYSQMELRVAAAITQDEKMIDFFKKGKDIHRMTASQIFSVKEEDVTDDMRALAKTLNFGVLYGMGIRGFQEAAGVSAKEAKKFIEEYMKTFSGIARYVQEIKEEARRLGYVETQAGRRRYIPEIHSSDPRMQRTGERIAINLPIQGLAADIIKMAMVKTDSSLKSFGDDVRLLLQVHDELLFEVKPNLVVALIPLIRMAMEGAYELAVPVLAEFKSGPNWADLKNVNLSQK